MEINIFTVDSLSDERLTELLTNNESFVIEGIKRRHMGRVIKHLESIMDAQGLKSRVYTKGRKALMAGMVTPMPVVILTGLATAITVGVHNAVTWKPDYEIAKNAMTGSLTVKCKKKLPKTPKEAQSVKTDEESMGA